jgi:hypothetical protein
MRIDSHVFLFVAHSRGGNMWLSALLYNIGGILGIAAIIFFVGVLFGVFLRSVSFSSVKAHFACSFLTVLASFSALKFLNAVSALFFISSFVIGAGGVLIGLEGKKFWFRLFRFFRFQKKEIVGIPLKER